MAVELFAEQRVDLALHFRRFFHDFWSLKAPVEITLESTVFRLGITGGQNLRLE